MTIKLARRLLAAAAVFLQTACATNAGVDQSTVEVVRYVNGYWYDGDGFRARGAYVAEGVFTDAPGGAPASTVDLNGAYVVPGFGEAHHHTVFCDPERIANFIDSGVVYAAIMNARVSSRECEAQYHGPKSVEVANALAGLTARNAHPYQIGLYFLDEDAIDGEWVHYINTSAELDEKWGNILAGEPDFVKIFLSYSEDFERLRNDAALPSWYRGLDPDLAPMIVSRAHDAGLRVAAHVMSAHDFDAAVRAGVDIIAHMPGFAPGAAFTGEDEPHPYLKALEKDDARYLISPDMARRTAARGVSVITTVSGAGAGVAPSSVIERNFATLRAANVTLLIGSDLGEFNSMDEASYLVKYDLAPAEDVLRSLCVTTPRAIFPGRQIGVLTPGAEATFVVLGGNPLEDFSAIRDVKMVVKKGARLRPVASDETAAE